MTPVSSNNQILDFLGKIKSETGCCLNNFYLLNSPKIEFWLNKELIKFEEIGKTIFLFKKNDGFLNLYYISKNHEQLALDLKKLQSAYFNTIFIVDIVDKAQHISKSTDVFLKYNFSRYTSLVRMSKSVDLNHSKNIDEQYLYYADNKESKKVSLLFEKYFDKFCEHIPLAEEIKDWSDNKGIIVYSEDQNNVQGFLIYEQLGLTGYLRYWFVHPEHRDKKIGSTLINKFFKENASTKRQLFWVINSNENAIKRYEHFGFKIEPLQNDVLINCNKKYEGNNN